MTGSWIDFYKPFADSYGRARTYLTGMTPNVPEQVCVTGTDAEKIQFVRHVLQHVFNVCSLSAFESHDLQTPLKYLPSLNKKEAKKKKKKRYALPIGKEAVQFLNDIDLIKTVTRLFKSPVAQGISKATNSLVEIQTRTYMSAKQAATSFNPVLKFLGVCMSPIYGRRKKDGPIGYRLHWQWDVSGCPLCIYYTIVYGLITYFLERCTYASICVCLCMYVCMYVYVCVCMCRMCCI
jgi:hypothetical protein